VLCYQESDFKYWVSLYVILHLHELAEGSSKCFKFHYLVSQSILLDTYLFFVFVQKNFCVDLWRVDFLYQPVDLHEKIQIGPYFRYFWLNFYVLNHFLNVIKCYFTLKPISQLSLLFQG
jgi:hypothetical protein